MSFPAAEDRLTTVSQLTNAGSSPRNLYIQGARGLFCLMVFVYHVHNSGLPTFPILNSPVLHFLFRSLEFGVEMFYGISGIVILGSLHRHRNVRVFVWDRITRIYPVLWGSVAFVLAATQFVRVDQPTVLETIASLFPPLPLLGTAHVNPIAWTLDFEMSFYLACAGLAYFGFRSPLGILLCAVCAAFLLAFPRVTMMLAGVLVYYYFLKPTLKPTVADRLARHSLLVFVTFLLGWRALIDGAVGGNVDALKPLLANDILSGVLLEIGILAVSAMGALALIGIAKGYGVLGRFLARPVMVAMGAISYSFYLWHIPVMAGVKYAIAHSSFNHGVFAQTMLFAIALPISLLAGIVSYTLLEVRAAKWLRSLGRVTPRPVNTINAVPGSGEAP